MKYKILSILCVLCLLAGCKIELPPDVSSSLESSASSCAVSLPTDENSAVVSSVSSLQSAAGSSSVPSVTASKANSSEAASKSASSQSAAPKTPAAPQSSAPAAEQNKEYNCSLFISCSEILKHKDKFSADQLEIVPANGLICEKSSIPFKEGDTVFDVLLRETKANNIQMDFVVSPVYNTNYIKSIDSIKEKNFGSASGWMYAVNGKQPPVGCNGYKLKNGDQIQWLYVCGQ